MGAIPFPVDESALVSRVQDGDEEAFAALVRLYARRAFSLAHRVLRNREDSEGLVQEAWMIALDRIGDVEPGRPFGPWFLRIVVNRALNAAKARSIRATDVLPEDAASREVQPDRAAENDEIRERFAAALGQLPERHRLIVEMFELEEMSSVEIAQVLELPEGTVRYHLHNARRALRESLAPLREVSDERS